MLAVVDQQQHLTARQEGREPLAHIPFGAAPVQWDAQRIGYRKRYLVTVPNRCQPNPERSVRVGVGGPNRGRECQGSLAGPTGADQGQEP